MAVKDTSVKYMQASWTGFNGFSYAAGTAITELDKILFDGWNSQTASGITVSGGIATVSFGSAHNFSMITTNVGPVINISGATPSSLNRDWRIEEVTSSTSFTLDVTGIVEDGSASGTITVKGAPLGYTLVYTSTNKRVFKTLSSITNYIRLSETSNAYILDTTVGEGATNVDTLTDTWSSTCDAYVKTGSSATSTYYDWYFVGNDDGFLLMKGSGSVGTSTYIDNSFGLLKLDASSYDTTYPTYFFWRGFTGISGADSYIFYNNNTNSNRIMRAHAAVSADGGSTCFLLSGCTLHYNNDWGDDSYTKLNAVTGKVHMFSAEAWDSVGPRGILPGFYDILGARTSFTHLENIAAGGPSSNKDFLIFRVLSTGGAMALDVTGPW